MGGRRTVLATALAALLVLAGGVEQLLTHDDASPPAATVTSGFGEISAGGSPAVGDTTPLEPVTTGPFAPLTPGTTLGATTGSAGGAVSTSLPIGASPSTTAAATTTTAPLPTAPPIGTPPSPGAAQLVRLAQFSAAEGPPTSVAFRPNDPAMYVATKLGFVFAISNAITHDKVLDLNQAPGGLGTTAERGLLSILFAPDGKSLYADWTASNGDIHVAEIPFQNLPANPAAARQVLVVPHPEDDEHNGGQLQWGPDGMLYISVGDGQTGCDPLRAADTTGPRLLGKILRIDPFHPTGGKQYAIPAGNPFGNETWAYGLRNPWRFTFDRATGDMWIGDVGEKTFEEVDWAPKGVAGRNYGWGKREGFHPTEGCKDLGGDRPPGAVDPVFDYRHIPEGVNPSKVGDQLRCAVQGGYMYRGGGIPALRGSYVFSDFCYGSLVALTNTPKGIVATELLRKSENPDGFGEDLTGELYVLTDGSRSVYRLDKGA